MTRPPRQTAGAGDLGTAPAPAAGEPAELHRRPPRASRSTERPPAPPSPAPPPPTQPWAPDARWQAVAACESTGDDDGVAPHRIEWTAVSPTGAFRGGYQFHRTSWRGVGGVGDPATASPREQTRRAEELYAVQGAGAWPHCGRWLR